MTKTFPLAGMWVTNKVYAVSTVTLLLSPVTLLEPLKIRNWGSYLFFFILPAFYIYETLVDWNYFRAAMLASSSR